MQSSTIETQILKGLISDSEYSSKALQYLEVEYFPHDSQKLLLTIVQEYVNEYHKTPSYVELAVHVNSAIGVPEDTHKLSLELIKDIEATTADVDKTWLLDQTEAFCQKQALFAALGEAVTIMDDPENNFDAIPEILRRALNIEFDPDLGSDWAATFMERLEYYNSDIIRFPFKSKAMNDVTAGGYGSKSLIMGLSGTGGGKSMWLIDEAAFNISIGRNVLYFTMEMSEHDVQQRVDANMLDCPINSLIKIDDEWYVNSFNTLKKRTQGRLIVKEYPAKFPTAATFRAFIRELEIKDGFKPDVVMIDYINICRSVFVKTADNLYSHVKSICEELRGLAQELDLPFLTVSQFNRTGAGSADPSENDVSDSLGTSMTADFMMAIITTDELRAQGFKVFKIMKSRFGGVGTKILMRAAEDKSRFTEAQDATSLTEPDYNEEVASLTPRIPIGSSDGIGKVKL